MRGRGGEEGDIETRKREEGEKEVCFYLLIIFYSI
jgi:hypothetical protein